MKLRIKQDILFYTTITLRMLFKIFSVNLTSTFNRLKFLKISFDWLTVHDVIDLKPVEYFPSLWVECIVVAIYVQAK